MTAPALRRTTPHAYRTREAFDVRSSAEVLANAFRRGSKAATIDQNDKQVENLTKKVQRGTLKLMEHLVLFARNWFVRGADQESVEALGHAYLSIVRGWYDKGADGMTLAELAKAETVVQCEADPEQWDLSNPNLSYTDICEAEAALSVHYTVLDRLVQRLRVEKYRVEASS